MVDASPSIVAAVFLWEIDMDMDDREFLVLSAKAAGVEVTWRNGWFRVEDAEKAKLTSYYWNPLKDIDTAMFIALKLNFTVAIYQSEIEIFARDDDRFLSRAIESTDDKKEVLCRAITMLAAGIGKGMQ